MRNRFGQADEKADAGDKRDDARFRQHRPVEQIVRSPCQAKPAITIAATIVTTMLSVKMIEQNSEVGTGGNRCWRAQCAEFAVRHRSIARPTAIIAVDSTPAPTNLPAVWLRTGPRSWSWPYEAAALFIYNTGNQGRGSIQGWVPPTNLDQLD